MRKVRNLKQFAKYTADDAIVIDGPVKTRVIAFDVNPYGPVAIYFDAVEMGQTKVKPVRTFVGWCETPETFEVTVDNTGYIVFEPTGEVWVRYVGAPVVNPNPGAGQTFTRMEKMGLYADDLTIALHRQAVINNIVTGRQNLQRDSYQRQLEGKLQELSDTIAKLTPKKEEPEGEQPPAQ